MTAVSRLAGWLAAVSTATATRPGVQLAPHRDAATGTHHALHRNCAGKVPERGGVPGKPQGRGGTGGSSPPSGRTSRVLERRAASWSLLLLPPPPLALDCFSTRDSRTVVVVVLLLLAPPTPLPESAGMQDTKGDPEQSATGPQANPNNIPTQSEKQQQYNARKRMSGDIRDNRSHARARPPHPTHSLRLPQLDTVHWHTHAHPCGGPQPPSRARVHIRHRARCTQCKGPSQTSAQAGARQCPVAPNPPENAPDSGHRHVGAVEPTPQGRWRRGCRPTAATTTAAALFLAAY